MPAVIRLRREGTKNRPFYRIVVTDKRARRDGAYIEQLGVYDPLVEGENFKLDLAKAEAWLGEGAKPSDKVANLIKFARRKAVV